MKIGKLISPEGSINGKESFIIKVKFINDTEDNLKFSMSAKNLFISCAKLLMSLDKYNYSYSYVYRKHTTDNNDSYDNHSAVMFIQGLIENKDVDSYIFAYFTAQGEFEVTFPQ
jgi:hypothetical protein